MATVKMKFIFGLLHEIFYLVGKKLIQVRGKCVNFWLVGRLALVPQGKTSLIYKIEYIYLYTYIYIYIYIIYITYIIDAQYILLIMISSESYSFCRDGSYILYYTILHICIYIYRYIDS